MSKIKPLSRLVILAVVLFSMLGIIMPVFGGTGSIRIDPPLPQVQSSPATFSIWVEGGSTAYDPHIFLVQTKTSYESFSTAVVVSWDDGMGGEESVNIPYGSWITPGILNKLPPGTSSGAGYTVASLKSHLGETEEEIYWVFVPILGSRELEADNVDEEFITVTLPATSNPYMMVYILGKSTQDGVEYDYDMRVPPTIPGGFLIPEVPYGTIATLITMLGAFYVFYAKRG